MSITVYPSLPWTGSGLSTQLAWCYQHTCSGMSSPTFTMAPRKLLVATAEIAAISKESSVITPSVIIKMLITFCKCNIMIIYKNPNPGLIRFRIDFQIRCRGFLRNSQLTERITLSALPVMYRFLFKGYIIPSYILIYSAELPRKRLASCTGISFSYQ